MTGLAETIRNIRLDHLADNFDPPDGFQKASALAAHLECKISDIEHCSYDSNCFEAEGGEYLVVTDAEADEIWEERLDSYLEECIYPDLPETMRFYFDDEAWKRDARFDGRGHAISSYDGNEYDAESIDGETFYIFRMN